MICKNCKNMIPDHFIRRHVPRAVLDGYCIYGLAPSIRAAFKELGFEFGVNVITITHCPYCPDYDLSVDEKVSYLLTNF